MAEDATQQRYAVLGWGSPIRDLDTLAGKSLDEAVRHIENAPPVTDMPLGRRLRADPWWRAQATRLAAARA